MLHSYNIVLYFLDKADAIVVINYVAVVFQILISLLYFMQKQRCLRNYVLFRRGRLLPYVRYADKRISMVI